MNGLTSANDMGSTQNKVEDKGISLKFMDIFYLQFVMEHLIYFEVKFVLSGTE